MDVVNKQLKAIYSIAIITVLLLGSCAGKNYTKNPKGMKGAKQIQKNMYRGKPPYSR